jgi:hypothetical protein
VINLNFFKSKLIQTPSKYTCQYCNVEKELNSENFQKVRNFKYGYSTVCNECHVESKKIKKNK